MAKRVGSAPAGNDGKTDDRGTSKKFTYSDDRRNTSRVGSIEEDSNEIDKTLKRTKMGNSKKTV